MFPLLPESRDGILLVRSDLLLLQVFSEHLLSSRPRVGGSGEVRGPGACTESGYVDYANVE